MKLRTNRLTAALSAIVLTAVSYAASPGPTTDTPLVADEATKDVKYDPFATPPPAQTISFPAPETKKADDVVPDRENMADSDTLSLSPYIVRDLPDRTLGRVNEAIAQRKKLESRVYYKRDVTPTVRAEFLSAPEPGSNGPSGKANFPLFRLTW